MYSARKNHYITLAPEETGNFKKSAHVFFKFMENREAIMDRVRHSLYAFAMHIPTNNREKINMSPWKQTIKRKEDTNRLSSSNNYKSNNTIINDPEEAAKDKGN